MTSSTHPATAFQALRGFVRSRTKEKRCELCGLTLASDHSHLFRCTDGFILCACEACAILFSHRDGAQKLIRIPRDARRLDSFELNDADWNALRLPIELAFFVRNSEAGRVIAYYPSPAGSTESLLNLDAWEDLVRRNPILDTMEPDVEALLVDRSRGMRRYFIAPIDRCYELTGIIRTRWRGFSGGDEVWSEVDQFFVRLAEGARA